MSDTETGYRIENIVMSGTASSGNAINIDEMVSKLKNAYRKERFPALFIKSRDGGNSTFLLFNSGSFVATGIKNVDDGKQFIQEISREIEKLGIIIKDQDYKVVNITCTGKFHSKVDLNRFMLETTNSRYEPEVFPGVIHQIDGATFLIFKAGKFVCVGLKDEKKVGVVVKEMREVVESKNLYIEEDNA